MERVLVYCSRESSARLAYVLNWLLKERLQVRYTITHSEEEAADAPFVIAYGKPLLKAISIPDTGLLWQTGITRTEPATGNWHNVSTLFASEHPAYTFPFDLFSAVFYLLSRYEEYYDYQPDKHGRYPATASVLYKKGWLQRPVVDEWVCELRKQLKRAGAEVQPSPFVFQPTYDIDIAYSHLYKGVTRIMGAYMRALLKLDVRQVNERTKVLKRKQKDPFDSFRWLRQLHKEYGYKPLYFVLAALETTAFDKNIHPQHPAMLRVIKNLSKDGALGIHPSYFSDRGTAMSKEHKVLEQISGQGINTSRQHYIKVRLPHTYHQLMKNGITEDYSMGYGSHLGFRAGTGASFMWYDITKEAAVPLRIHPFCFMDTTAHYEMKLSPHDAFAKLHHMTQLLEQAGSTLVTVFHNFSLGTAHEWKGWKDAYEHFLHEKTIHPKTEHSII